MKVLKFELLKIGRKYTHFLKGRITMD